MPWFVSELSRKLTRIFIIRKIHPKRVAILVFYLAVIVSFYKYFCRPLYHSVLKTSILPHISPRSSIFHIFNLVLTEINMYGHLVYPILFLYTVLTLILRKSCTGLITKIYNYFRHPKHSVNSLKHLSKSIQNTTFYPFYPFTFNRKFSGQKNISMFLVVLMGMVPYIEYISVFRNIQARKLYLEELENAIYASWAESQDVLHEVGKLRRTLMSKSDGASKSERDDVTENRLKTMHQTCHKERNKLSLNHQYYGIGHLKREWLSHIIYDQKHKLLMCYIPGVGSTNWRRILAYYKTGLVKDHDFDNFKNISKTFVNDPNSFRTLSSFSKKDIIKILYDHNVFRFMFVRDPFTRLVSSYRSKFRSHENNTESLFTKLYAHHINTNYHNETIALEDKDREKQPNEIKHIDEEQYLVTFQAFAKYLTDHKTIQHNEHWDQYYDLCFPCYIKYDFIGRMEHIETEYKTILRKLRKFDDRKSDEKIKFEEKLKFDNRSIGNVGSDLSLDEPVDRSTSVENAKNSSKQENAEHFENSTKPSLNSTIAAFNTIKNALKFPKLDMSDQPINVDIAIRHLLHLDKNLIRKLYEVYRLDFQLFGYDATPYLRAHDKILRKQELLQVETGEHLKNVEKILNDQGGEKEEKLEKLEKIQKEETVEKIEKAVEQQKEQKKEQKKEKLRVEKIEKDEKIEKIRFEKENDRRHESDGGASEILNSEIVLNEKLVLKSISVIKVIAVSEKENYPEKHLLKEPESDNDKQSFDNTKQKVVDSEKSDSNSDTISEPKNTEISEKLLKESSLKPAKLAPRPADVAAVGQALQAAMQAKPADSVKVESIFLPGKQETVDRVNDTIKQVVDMMEHPKEMILDKSKQFLRNVTGDIGEIRGKVGRLGGRVIDAVEVVMEEVGKMDDGDDERHEENMLEIKGEAHSENIDGDVVDTFNDNIGENDEIPAGEGFETELSDDSQPLPEPQHYEATDSIDTEHDFAISMEQRSSENSDRHLNITPEVHEIAIKQPALSENTNQETTNQESTDTDTTNQYPKNQPTTNHKHSNQETTNTPKLKMLTEHADIEEIIVTDENSLDNVLEGKNMDEMADSEVEKLIESEEMKHEQPPDKTADSLSEVEKEENPEVGDKLLDAELTEAIEAS